MTCGGIWYKAYLVAEAGQANEDGGVNGADAVSRSGGHGSIGGITEDDGVDLGRIVFLIISLVSGCGGMSSFGAIWGEMYLSIVLQCIEDRRQRRDCGDDSEQDDSWKERLAGGDIESLEWSDSELRWAWAAA